ncbi:hypothetical protein Z951_19415 [Streptomyces sp. PRh5]|nr:hypothetical protein Z951_19415 [Streptomyces sp. PRh5]
MSNEYGQQDCLIDRTFNFRRTGAPAHRRAPSPATADPGRRGRWTVDRAGTGPEPDRKVNITMETPPIVSAQEWEGLAQTRRGPAAGPPDVRGLRGQPA